MTNFSSLVGSDFTGYINATTVFGEIQKSVISKDFKGGKVNNFFGSTVLDFSNADINGIAVVDISQAFGEIIISVPANWRVEVDLTQLFAAVEDKRMSKYQKNSNDKILVLTGISGFANIELRNAG